MDAAKWELTREEADELKRLIKKAMDAVGDGIAGKAVPDGFFESRDPFLGIAFLEIAYEHDGPESFEFGALVEFVNAHAADFAGSDLPRVAELLLRRGICERSAACATELGANYYSGGIVERDYASAAELYELGSSWGSYQATVNLGYIYEYGRMGPRDLARAFSWYALASTMRDAASEALYKMGDCYARGMPSVGRNLDIAHGLWRRSYDAAVNDEERAQPAVRIAPLLIDPRCGVAAVGYDPLLALRLYQEAEVGLRISIGHGLAYYERRLQEAVAGQVRARELLDAEGADSAGFGDARPASEGDGGAAPEGEFDVVVRSST